MVRRKVANLIFRSGERVAVLVPGEDCLWPPHIDHKMFVKPGSPLKEPSDGTAVLDIQIKTIRFGYLGVQDGIGAYTEVGEV